MKKFKDFLNEDIAWQQSLSSLLFDLPRSSMNDVIIPISPSIFKRVFPETIRSIVFHLTDMDGLERLKKIQKTKKSISAFYNMNPDRIIHGRRMGRHIVRKRIGNTKNLRGCFSFRP